jgi:tetratricopeptide (TPR) repeat protein
MLGQPSDQQQALAWFEADHQVLLAAIAVAAESGFGTHAWQLPWTMATFLRTRGHWQEWADTQRTALDAATRLGDIAVQAICRRTLGTAYTVLGDYDQARDHLAHSLMLERRLGNRLGEAKVHQNLGALADYQGGYAEALDHAEQALRLYQTAGDKAAEAEMLNNVGYAYARLGDYQQARAFCQQALALSAQTGHHKGEAYALDSLGYAEHHLGNLAEATACYQRALSLFRHVGDLFNEAHTLAHLGDTRQAAGEPAQAKGAWQQALAILDDLQDPEANQVRAKLASTDARLRSEPLIAQGYHTGDKIGARNGFATARAALPVELGARSRPRRPELLPSLAPIAVMATARPGAISRAQTCAVTSQPRTVATAGCRPTGRSRWRTRATPTWQPPSAAAVPTICAVWAARAFRHSAACAAI